MNEKLKEFVKKVAEDDALATQLKECKSLDTAYELASKAVGGFSKEEFEAGMKKIDEHFKKANSDELSDDDLANVAGGMSTSSVTAITSAATTGASAAATAAAI